MRRVVCCLLVCLLLLGAVPVCLAEGAWKDIATPEDLLAIRQDPGGSYRLTEDIDLAGIDWIPMAFTGELDGQGHDIYNLTVRAAGEEVRTTYDGNKKPYETVFAGLFSTVENAKISNLNLVGVDVETDIPEHCFAAGLAGYTSHSEIRDCSVTGKVWMYGNNVMVGVAGIAGFGCGEIHNCKADVELFFSDHSTGTKCEEFMGGILACGIANITGCRVDIRGYDSCHGYVHNGGLVGMYYHCTLNYPGTQVENCQTYGKITFFENNPDRRAYCAAYIGEALTRPTAYTGNTGDFVRDEKTDYDVELFPEMCADPQYDTKLVVPTCQSSGYQEHTCRSCGYTYRDSYLPKAHQPGDPEILEEADYGIDGLSQTHCTVCGTLLGKKTIPALVRSESIRMESTLNLKYKDRYTVAAMVEPQNATDRSLTWSSSDESVVKVDPSGQLLAVGRGTATLTCSSSDGGATGTCQVTVGYTFGQWLIKILLFGWIWY